MRRPISGTSNATNDFCMDQNDSRQHRRSTVGITREANRLMLRQTQKPKTNPMTRAELLARYPNASESFLRKNADLSPRSSRQPAEPERTPRQTIEAPTRDQENHPAQFLVRITDVRRRLIDVDNLCGKFHTDFLRHCGCLPLDSPETTTIEVSQRKVRKGELPHTEIEVFEL